jgi:hypothetical protein
VFLLTEFLFAFWDEVEDFWWLGGGFFGHLHFVNRLHGTL